MPDRDLPMHRRAIQHQRRPFLRLVYALIPLSIETAVV